MVIPLLKWLRRPVRRRLTAARYPFFELLEDRLTPASYSWIGPISGDWSNPANWLGGPQGTAPGAGDTAFINATGNNYTVSLDINVTVAALVVGSPSVTFQIANHDITVTGPAQLLGGNTVLSNASWFGPGTVFNQASLIVHGQVSFQAPLQQDGMLAILAGPTGPADMIVTGPLFNTGQIFIKTSASGIGSRLLLTGNLTNASGLGSGAGGLIDVGAGTSLQFNAGTHLLAPNSALVGGGTVLVKGGVVTVAGDYQVAGKTQVDGGVIHFVAPNLSTTGRLDLASGVVGGTSPLRVANEFNWTGGTLANTGGVTTAGTTNIVGPALKQLNGQWNNAGAALWEDAGAIDSDGGTFINLPGAVLEIRNDTTFLGHNGALFDNQGLVRKTAGLGTTTFGGPSLVFQNNGLFELKRGAVLLSSPQGGSSSGPFKLAAGTTLIFDAGKGVFDLGPAASVTGAGSVRVRSGIVNFGGLYNIRGAGRTVIAGGEAVFHNATTLRRVRLLNGQIRGVGPLQLVGQLDWFAGTLAGNLLVLPAGVVNLNGPAAKFLMAGSAINQGLVNWNGGDLIFGSTDFRNDLDGRFLVRSNGSLSSFSQGGSFLNLGLFRRMGSLTKPNRADTATVGVPFTNQGTVEILQSTLSFQAAPYSQTGPGSITFLSGAVLDAPGSVQIAAGLLRGDGVIRGSVFNDGVLAPGNPVGVLHIDGSYHQGLNGTLLFDFAGPPNIHDQLLVNGSLSLDGTVLLRTLSGFAPEPGDQFVLASFGAESRDDSAKEGLDLGDGRSFDDDFGDKELTVTVIGSEPEPPSPPATVDPLVQSGLAFVATTVQTGADQSAASDAHGRLVVLDLQQPGLVLPAPLNDRLNRAFPHADSNQAMRAGADEEQVRGDIQGQVFTDLNGDGYRQGEEGPRDSQLVFIDRNRNNRFDEGEQFTWTNSNGEYRFRNVEFGAHAVHVRLGRTSQQTQPPTPNHVVEVTRSKPAVAGINFGVLDRRLVRPASRPVTTPSPSPSPEPPATTARPVSRAPESSPPAPQEPLQNP